VRKTPITVIKIAKHITVIYLFLALLRLTLYAIFFHTNYTQISDLPVKFSVLILLLKEIFDLMEKMSIPTSLSGNLSVYHRNRFAQRTLFPIDTVIMFFHRCSAKREASPLRRNNHPAQQVSRVVLVPNPTSLSISALTLSP
jgi:hypothetical protein